MKIKWNSIGKGVRYKEHPKRKHGIRVDRYFSIRYQVNGKSCESGLGWASEGWTKEKAVAERVRLIEDAKSGHGVLTRRQTQKKKAKIVEEQEKIKIAETKAEQKKNLTITSFFNDVYYPQIKKENKIEAYKREESLFRLWIDQHIGKLSFRAVCKEDIENIFYDMVDSGRSIRSAEYPENRIKRTL